MKIPPPNDITQLDKELNAYWSALPQANKDRMFEHFIVTPHALLSLDIYKSNSDTPKELADIYVATLFRIMKQDMCGRQYGGETGTGPYGV